MRNIRLGINVDHIATIRNARGGNHPCPIAGAKIAQDWGADGITAHLREDRRHIKDEDILRLKSEINLPLNLEMAATEEMLKIALNVFPNAVCLVPEKREELTTEGGLDIIKNIDNISNIIKPLKSKGIKISLFVDPNLEQIKSAKNIGADIVEIHTGKYCILSDDKQKDEFIQIKNSIEYAYALGLECHAGHGLDFTTASKIAKIPQIVELNIGHFIISEAIFMGLGQAIKKMKELINQF